MVFLEGLFDALFGYALSWPPVFGIIFVSFILSVLIILIYKYFTDQKEMKRLKGELNDFQKKVKSLRDSPEKMLEVQKEMMKTNMEYMKKSMKVTFITFIPMILILGWMDANFAYQPLLPDHDFGLGVVFKDGVAGNVSISVPEGIEVVGDDVVAIDTGTARFKLKGNAGEYLVSLSSHDEEVSKEVIISDKKYAPVSKSFDSDVFSSVVLGNQKLIVIWKLSWLWTYFICMLVFSLVLRKLFKVY